jgi:hypothetical protein
MFILHQTCIKRVSVIIRIMESHDGMNNFMCNGRIDKRGLFVLYTLIMTILSIIGFVLLITFGRYIKNKCDSISLSEFHNTILVLHVIYTCIILRAMFTIISQQLYVGEFGEERRNAINITNHFYGFNMLAMIISIVCIALLGSVNVFNEDELFRICPEQDDRSYIYYVTGSYAWLLVVPIYVIMKGLFLCCGNVAYYTCVYRPNIDMRSNEYDDGNGMPSSRHVSITIINNFVNIDTLNISPPIIQPPPPCIKYKVPRKMYSGNVSECSVCYSEECRILSCGHIMCDECYEVIYKTPDVRMRTCPQCRTPLVRSADYKQYIDAISFEYGIHDIIDTIIDGCINNKYCETTCTNVDVGMSTCESSITVTNSPIVFRFIDVSDCTEISDNIDVSSSTSHILPNILPGSCE